MDFLFRLSETLAFPKAWYRRALVRRLFLGELKSSSVPSDPEPIPIDPGITGAKVGPVPGAAPRRGSVAQTNVRRSSVAQPPAGHPEKKTWVGRTSAQSWETLVVFAVGFKELKVIIMLLFWYNSRGTKKIMLTVAMAMAHLIQQFSKSNNCTRI